MRFFKNGLPMRLAPPEKYMTILQYTKRPCMQSLERMLNSTFSVMVSTTNFNLLINNLIFNLVPPDSDLGCWGWDDSDQSTASYWDRFYAGMQIL